MNKRKSMKIGLVACLGILAFLEQLRLNQKMKKLENKTDYMGDCHNKFCVIQHEYNKTVEDVIREVQEEIGSVYEHMEELSKIYEKGR